MSPRTLGPSATPAEVEAAGPIAARLWRALFVEAKKPEPLRGTDRAALRLALGELRNEVLHRAHGYGWPSLFDTWVGGRFRLDYLMARFGDPRVCVGSISRARIYRARVALWARALLRAEAGDRGRWWVGYREPWPYIGLSPTVWQASEIPPPAFVRDRRRAWKAQPGDTYRLARPLWTQAPPHEGP